MVVGTVVNCGSAECCVGDRTESWRRIEEAAMTTLSGGGVGAGVVSGISGCWPPGSRFR